MPLVHPIPEELAELIARRLRAIGDPTRIRLLDHMRDGEASVGELTDALHTSQQNVSKHLGVLLEAHIVGRRKDGTRALYRIIDDSVFRLCEDVCGSVTRQIADINRLVEGTH